MLWTGGDDWDGVDYLSDRDAVVQCAELVLYKCREGVFGSEAGVSVDGWTDL